MKIRHFTPSCQLRFNATNTVVEETVRFNCVVGSLLRGFPRNESFRGFGGNNDYFVPSGFNLFQGTKWIGCGECKAIHERVRRGWFGVALGRAFSLFVAREEEVHSARRAAAGAAPGAGGQDLIVISDTNQFW